MSRQLLGDFAALLGGLRSPIKSPPRPPPPPCTHTHTHTHTHIVIPFEDREPTGLKEDIASLSCIRNLGFFRRVRFSHSLPFVFWSTNFVPASSEEADAWMDDPFQPIRAALGQAGMWHAAAPLSDCKTRLVGKKERKKEEACIQNDVIIHSWWYAFFMAQTKTCVFPATPLPSSPVLLTPKEKKKRVRTVRGTHIINRIMSYLLIQHCQSRSFSRGPL